MILSGALPTLTSSPQLFGWATANVALVVSLLALVAAGLSSLLAWKTYRRAGARISVDMADRIVFTHADDGTPQRVPMMVVTVRNRGLAPATVQNVGWQQTDDDGKWPKTTNFSEPMFEDLPKEIGPNSAESFFIHRAHLEEVAEGRAVSVRALVTLVTGEQHLSRPIRLGAAT